MLIRSIATVLLFVVLCAFVPCKAVAGDPRLDRAERQYVTNTQKHRTVAVAKCEKLIADAISGQRVDEAIAMRRELDGLLMGAGGGPDSASLPTDYVAGWTAYTEAAQTEVNVLVKEYDAAIEAATKRKDLPAITSLRSRKDVILAAPAEAVPVSADSIPNVISRRFVSEVPEASLGTAESSLPDELEVDVMPGRFRISGSARHEVATVEGKRVGHFGKVVLVKGLKLDGLLMASANSRSDGVGYQLYIAKRSGEAERFPMMLTAGQIAQWSVQRQGASVAVIVKQGDSDPMVAVSIPTTQFDCVGFVATVRRPGDTAGLTVAIK